MANNGRKVPENLRTAQTTSLAGADGPSAMRHEVMHTESLLHDAVTRGDEPWAGSPVFSPDVIQTSRGTPVLLGPQLGTDVADGGPRIVAIDGELIDPGVPTPLPGIRVGAGDGTGFIFRRELDGQLVFAPDDSFSGVTMFACAIADVLGDQATFIATVSVRPDPDHPVEIGFVDGSIRASVQAGAQTSILGALAIIGIDASEYPVMRVYENDEATPSTRFVVSGDKLRLTEPLDHATDATVLLRIVASDGQRELASGNFTIDIRPAGVDTDQPGCDQFQFGLDHVAGLRNRDEFVLDIATSDDEPRGSTYTALADSIASLTSGDLNVAAQLPPGRGEPFGD